LGHDVTTAAEAGFSRLSDAELLDVAHQRDSILVTRDRDFGGLVFAKSAGAGVVYLRISPTTISVVHDELRRILSLYSEAELSGSFIVVEAGRHRRRPLP
jgi:predicted nuclease of predicted toxin-antitoxin system